MKITNGKTHQTIIPQGLLLLAVLGAFLACSTAAFAASQTSVVLPYDGPNAVPLSVADGGIHENARGYVTFKTARGGGWDVTVQLSDAAVRFPYFIKSNHILLATLTTNKKGNGQVQFHVTATEANDLSENISIFSSLPPAFLHLFYAANRM
jgi:hypothetical protein